ncbi:hypothetical protein AB0R12_36535, partial [Streptomyces niveus]|uniref:hypothetical protein n=1 Tax=Streptomyces niveus TaxID=193462 RepID=UPI00341904C3
MWCRDAGTGSAAERGPGPYANVCATPADGRPLPVNSLDDRSLGVRQKYTLEKVTADGTATT